MQRKLIQQRESFTVTLPKQWIDEHKLTAKDTVDVSIDNQDVVISPTRRKQTKREIRIEASSTNENTVRLLIVNAYRAGYDKMLVSYKGKKEHVESVVANHLLGFELFSEKSKYILESISEPSYENFEKIIQRQFFILLEMVRNISDPKIKELDSRVRKYDNFLKRCLQRKIFSVKVVGFSWQFLTSLVQISRACVHTHKYTQKSKKDGISKKMLPLFEEALLKLQKGYLSHNMTQLELMHAKVKEIVYKDSSKYLRKEPVFAHYSLQLLRQIYRAVSPLIGMITIRNQTKADLN